jgi:hypothetical protein
MFLKDGVDVCVYVQRKTVNFSTQTVQFITMPVSWDSSVGKETVHGREDRGSIAGRERERERERSLLSRPDRLWGIFSLLLNV